MKKLAFSLLFAAISAGLGAQTEPDRGREIVIQKVVIGPDGKADTIVQRIEATEDGLPKIRFERPGPDGEMPGEGRRKIMIEKNVETGDGQRPDGEMRVEIFEEHEQIGDRHSIHGSHRKSLFQHEVGLNATSLIAKLTRSGGETVGNGSPFSVSYKLFWHGLGLRTAGGWASVTNEDDGTAGAGSALTTKTSDRDLRVGLEYQFRVARRWRAYAGADYLIGDGSRTIRSFFIDAFGNLQSADIGQRARRQGMGGAIGLQFMLNRNIGIGAESTAYWLRQMNSEIDELSPSEGNVETASTTFSISPPSAIFFYFRF